MTHNPSQTHTDARGATDAPSNALPDPLNRPGANAGAPEPPNFKELLIAAFRQAVSDSPADRWRNFAHPATYWAKLVGCDVTYVYNVATKHGYGQLIRRARVYRSGEVNIKVANGVGRGRRALVSSGLMLSVFGFIPDELRFVNEDGKIVLEAVRKLATRP